MRSLFLYAILLCLLHSGLGCVPTPPSPDNTTPSPDETTTPPDEETTPPEDECAEGLDLQPAPKAKETGYKDGGPVEKGNKLSFDAAKPDKACWKNHEAKDGVDELDYAWTEDGKALEDCGKSDGKIGKGPAMVVYTPEEQGKNDAALFHSCSVLCSNGPAKVTVNGAKSKDVKMEVCTADSFTDSKPKNCQPVKFGKPVQVGKKGKNTIYDVVIKSSGFKEKTFAAIQKIKVDFKECEDEPASGGDGPCGAACSFDGSTCGFQKDPANTAATEFKAYETQTIVGNLDSGVNARLDGNPAAANPIVSDTSFLATPQNPGDLDVASADVDVTEDVEMVFDVYDACDGNAGKVCFDTPDNCPYSTDVGVTVADREWKQEQTVPVPAGTKKIFLVGDNSQGQRFCATGFKKVNFRKPGSSEFLCEPPQNDAANAK